MIVPANKFDANLLTKIALTSKAFWGYSSDFLNSWQKDLTVTQKMIEKAIVFKFLYKNEAIGFYMLNKNKPNKNIVELEMLFILPKFIKKGIGKQLLQHSFLKAKELQANYMTVLSDPNAQKFYEKQGFRVVSKKESSIKNRFLPIMEKDLR